MPVRGKMAEVAFMEKKYFILFLLIKKIFNTGKYFIFFCKRCKSNWYIAMVWYMATIKLVQYTLLYSMPTSLAGT